MSELASNIEKFQRDVITGSISLAEVRTRISEIFGNKLSIPIQGSTYPEGLKVFRARRLGGNDLNLPLQTLRIEADAWEAPEDKIVSPGRLNLPGQRVLYTCPTDPVLAISEARAENDKYVAVIVYRTVREIAIASIGNYDASTLPKDEMTKLFYKFLEHEFSRLVPLGEEGRYYISQTIADSFYNYPDQDAWRYRSVQSNEKFNLAFLPEKARSCLKLQGALICENAKSTQTALSVSCVVGFNDRTGNAEYHQIGSAEQRTLFPEI